MIVSNEPGYYKIGEYGIRIENLVTVVETEPPAGEGRGMLGFETLTLAPIDLTLIEPGLLTRDETAWLDSYHAEVRASLAPLVDSATATWMERATRPIEGGSRVT
jgi:Xaa-Pro aminopeptidase